MEPTSCYVFLLHLRYFNINIVNLSFLIYMFSNNSIFSFFKFTFKKGTIHENIFGICSRLLIQNQMKSSKKNFFVAKSNNKFNLCSIFGFLWQEVLVQFEFDFKIMSCFMVTMSERLI